MMGKTFRQNDEFSRKKKKKFNNRKQKQKKNQKYNWQDVVPDTVWAIRKNQIDTSIRN